VYVQIASGDLAAARASLEALEQVQPTAEVAHQLAVLLVEMGDAVGALEATRRAVTREPGDGQYRRELFERLTAAGAWEGLVEAGSEAGAGAAGGGLAAYYRGVGLARLGRKPDAIESLAQVVEHGSPDLVALVGSAGWLLQLGAYVEAERSARGALAGREEDPTLHHLLAMVLTRQGRESEGLAHYRRAAEVRSDDPGFRFDLLVSLCTLGRTEELDDALQRARRDFPDDPRFVELADRCIEEPAT
jgi:Flp pilus assembly protein TadD